MTEKDITEWIKTSHHITTDYCEYDSDANHYARDIFEKDGRLWAVEYLNGKIIPELKLSDNGELINEGVYEPREVVKLPEGNCYYYANVR